MIFHSLLARASLVATFGTWRKETKKGEIRSVKKNKKKRGKFGAAKGKAQRVWKALKFGRNDLIC